MDLKLLDKHLSELLPPMGFRLIETSFVQEDKEKYLRVIVDKYHHGASLDEIVKISEDISLYLDNLKEEFDFTLDVTTLGAEKEIALDELKDYVGAYIKVTLLEGIKGEQTFTGSLESMTEDKLIIVYFDKGRKKNQTIEIKNIKKVNRSIK